MVGDIYPIQEEYIPLYEHANPLTSYTAELSDLGGLQHWPRKMLSWRTNFVRPRGRYRSPAEMI
jgi:hypothetical protein